MKKPNPSKQEREYAYHKYPDGRYTALIKIKDSTKERYIPDGKDLSIAHVPNYSTTIGPLSLADLKNLRKLIRYAIRNYESPEELQI